MTKESKRNLSPKESERKAQFDVVCKTMEKEGYTKTDLTVGIIQANIFAIILMMPFAGIVIFLYRMKNPSGDFYFGAGFIWLFALFLFLIVVHEGIHGLTWSMFAKKHFHSIEFGVIWQALFGTSEQMAVHHRCRHAHFDSGICAVSGRGLFWKPGADGAVRDDDLQRRRRWSDHPEAAAAQDQRKDSGLL